MTDERTLSEATERSIALVRKMASTVLIRYNPRSIDTKDIPLGDYREAAAIVAMLPEPVDPDIQIAREIAADISLSDGGSSDFAKYIRDGRYDSQREYRIAFCALKRGRELEKSNG